jgi:segregation and condensation protein B
VNVHQIVEAVLFASDAPLTADEIARADEMLDEDQVQDALAQLAAEYDDAARAFQVVELAEGYQLLTRPEFDPYLERFDNVPRPSRLSGPSLETLAIIAYRQPIGRLEIEYIRGVGASGVIRTLQDRRLVDVVGRAEGLGRPLLYGTTRHFLEHFGFRSLEDLPRPEELSVVLRERIPLGTEDEILELTGSGEVEDSGDEAAVGEAEESGDLGESAELRESGELEQSAELREAGEPEESGELREAGEPEESGELEESGQLDMSRELGGPREADDPEAAFDAGGPDEEATMAARPEGDAHPA